jgi:hypothetical protein
MLLLQLPQPLPLLMLLQHHLPQNPHHTMTQAADGPAPRDAMIVMHMTHCGAQRHQMHLMLPFALLGVQHVAAARASVACRRPNDAVSTAADQGHLVLRRQQTYGQLDCRSCHCTPDSLYRGCRKTALLLQRL